MIQKVTLNKGNVLSKDKILDTINEARRTWQYARFTLYDGKFFSVHYGRDRDVDFATNVRDFMFWLNYQKLKKNFSQLKIADFIFDFIKKFNV